MNEPCRICGGSTALAFEVRVLRAYDCEYCQCVSCGFLQAADPFWIQEAYERPITRQDTGILVRNLAFARMTAVVAHWLCDRRGRFLDYAGGYGLLTRLMRDYGFDYSWNDPFAANLFADGFEGNLEGPWNLITSFEVFEHITDPLILFGEILGHTDHLLFSTELFEGEAPKPESWFYYHFDQGQHVSFYTLPSLVAVSERLGFNLYSDGRWVHLLSAKHISKTAFRLWVRYTTNPQNLVFLRRFSRRDVV